MKDGWRKPTDDGGWWKMKDTVSVGSFSADFCPLSTNYVPTLGVSAACSLHNKQVYSLYSQAQIIICLKLCTKHTLCVHHCTHKVCLCQRQRDRPESERELWRFRLQIQTEWTDRQKDKVKIGQNDILVQIKKWIRSFCQLMSLANKMISKKFECKQCDFKTSQRGSLWQHNKSAHEGVKFLCQQCDYKASQKSNLLTHIKSKHEGVKFPCDQCNYKATQKAHLSKHIKSKHEGMIKKA